MFNKFAKSVRWIVLAGILYSLYTIMLKDDLEYNSQTDPVVLMELANNASKSRDTFVIYKRLLSLYPDNEQFKEFYYTSVKQQANKLIDAHERMLLPVAIGNYRYVRNIRFGKDEDGKFVLIFNMTTIFNDLDTHTKNTLKKIFNITHDGMYTYYGFDDYMRLLLVPTFDNLKDIKIIDLNRKTLELPPIDEQLRTDKPLHK